MERGERIPAFVADLAAASLPANPPVLPDTVGRFSAGGEKSVGDSTWGADEWHQTKQGEQQRPHQEWQLWENSTRFPRTRWVLAFLWAEEKGVWIWPGAWTESVLVPISQRMDVLIYSQNIGSSPWNRMPWPFPEEGEEVQFFKAVASCNLLNQVLASQAHGQIHTTGLFMYGFYIFKDCGRKKEEKSVLDTLKTKIFTMCSNLQKTFSSHYSKNTFKGL